MKGREGCDFSFSGLKTAVRKQVLECGADITETQKADICASFQHTAAESLCDRIKNAIAQCKALYPEAKHVVVAGGVAANQYLKSCLVSVIGDYGMTLHTPPIALCTDNAAMIAWAGVERFKKGYTDSLDVEPKARWPL
jgi:N6-L-threonylcarbamoyladenine synthase